MRFAYLFPFAGTAITLAACLPAAPTPPQDDRGAIAFRQNCLACHDLTMVSRAPKSRADWQATVDRMIGLGAKPAAADIPVIVDYLTQHHGLSSAGSGKAPDAAPAAGVQLIAGKPIDTRPPELETDHPAFPGQTRAPYHKTVPINRTIIASGLNNPWALAFLPDGRFLVTEKPGAIRIIGKDGQLSPPLGGVPAVFYKSQVGLLDLIRAPDFAKSKRLYFSYMEPQPGDLATLAIASANLDLRGNTIKNMKVIFRAEPAITMQRVANAGGRLAIAPDGTLFAAIGDRVPPLSAGWNKAQDLGTTLGKIVHITVNGAPAPGNPFLGRKDIRPEIWSYGHRSIQGLAFDARGRLWEHEHGPRGGDEINLIRPGINYGWPIIAHGIEYKGALINGGKTEQEGMEQPRYYWDPVIAPSGMTFYSGREFPEWRGNILMGALRGARLTRLSLSADDKVVDEEPLLLDLNKRIRDVRAGPDGAVYVLTDEDNASLIRISRGAR